MRVTDAAAPDQIHKGMLSIGYNPTFEGKEQTIEVNILDFDKDIYGNTLTLEFIQHIRNEKKFDSLDALIAEIKNDELATRKLLSWLNYPIIDRHYATSLYSYIFFLLKTISALYLKSFSIRTFIMHTTYR